MKSIRIGTLALAIAGAANGANWHCFYKASVAALLAGAAADSVSSWGKDESNPAIGRNQIFAGRGIAIKAAITGGIFLPQVIWRRRLAGAPRAATFANVGVASAWGLIAVHNTGIRRPVQ